MSLTKYLYLFEGAWCFWGEVEANVGVRCYLIFFHSFLKVLDVLKKLLKLQCVI